MVEVLHAVREEAPNFTEMTLTQLRAFCKENLVAGYSKYNKPQLIEFLKGAYLPKEDNRPEAPAVEVVAAQPEVPERAWEDLFIPELSTLCQNLQGLPESDFLPEDLLRTINTIKDAATVDDLAQYTEDEFQAFSRTIKQELPKYQRQVHETVGLISKAAPIAVDVDYV